MTSTNSYDLTDGFVYSLSQHTRLIVIKLMTSTNTDGFVNSLWLED